jgi:hypothetical protein
LFHLSVGGIHTKLKLEKNMTISHILFFYLKIIISLWKEADIEYINKYIGDIVMAMDCESMRGLVDIERF